MIYFILWVIFLLIVILSVPIANWLENRARRAAMGPMPEPTEAEAEEEEAAEEAEPEMADEFGGGEDEEAGEAVFEETNDDDFKGFE